MEIIRGDTKKYKFQRKNSGGVITKKADEIYFTVKMNFINKDYIIQKKIDDMTFDENYYYSFTIEPQDTNNLLYGKYVYDLEVKDSGVVTTISKGIFEIKEEVTFSNNEV